MARTIPASLLRDSIQIEDYAGESGATGPAFADPVTVSAHVEPRRRLVVDRMGREVRTDMFAIVAPNTDVNPEARITHDGRTYRVLDVFKVPAPGGGTHHIELGLVGERGF